MKKTQVKFLGLFLAFSMFFAFSGTALAADPYGNFNSGSGTESDPFFISTSNELVTLSELVQNYQVTSAESQFYRAAYYKLTANIDMMGYDWFPIGNSGSRDFLGDFNGAGYTISNLQRYAGGTIGFFGFLSGNVHDLNLSNVNFHGAPTGTTAAIGGVAGVLYYGGVIENVNVSGTITAGFAGAGTNGRNAGGITGMVAGPNSRISGCSFNGNIVAIYSDAAFLGGIIGFVNQAGTGLTVDNCFSSGTITRPGTGIGYIGKIAGGWDTSAIYNNPPDFSFCYGTMTVDAAAYGNLWQGYDGIDFDPTELTKLGVYYNDGKVSAKNAHRLAVATLWLEIGGGMPSFSGLNGFQVMDDVMDGGLHRVTLGYMVAGGYGFTGVNAGLLNISGATGVTIKNARFVAYDEVGRAFDLEYTVEKEGGGGGITDPVNYDLNNDGTVDQLDLAIALRHFMAAGGDANWDAAKVADFNKDEIVDIEDYILLLNNMDW